MPNHQLPARIGVGPRIGFACSSLALWLGSLCLASLWGSAAHAQNLDAARLLPVGGQRGATVAIELPGKFEKWPIQFWAEPNQVQWVATETPGKITASIPADAKLGLHWVRMHSAESVSPLLRFLVGEYPGVLEAEPNDAFAKPQSIENLPAEIFGVLQKSGDVDHYQLRLSAGQRLVASLEANSTLKSPMDACLEIVDPRGNILAQNLDAVDLDPRMVFVAPKDGLYSVRIYAFPEAPDSTIGYAGGDKYQYRLQCFVGDRDDLAAGFQSDATEIAEPSNRDMPTILTLDEQRNRYAFFGALESAKDEDVLQVEDLDGQTEPVASGAGAFRL